MNTVWDTEDSYYIKKKIKKKNQVQTVISLILTFPVDFWVTIRGEKNTTFTSRFTEHRPETLFLLLTSWLLVRKLNYHILSRQTPENRIGPHATGSYGT